jgi:hypothetical protein
VSSGKPSFVGSLKALISFEKAKGRQKKASKISSDECLTFSSAVDNSGVPNKNGNIYGESILKKAWESYNSGKFVQEYMQSWTHNEDPFFAFHPSLGDYPVEIFVDESGKVCWPFERGVAYEFCKLDHWCNPSCRPGIISVMVPANKPGVYTRETVVVLFAEEQYIELQPTARVITDARMIRLCDEHFQRRGFEYLDDSQSSGPNFELLDFQKDFINDYRSRTEEIANRGNWSYRGSMPDNPISFGGTISHDPPSIKSYGVWSP